VEEIYNATFSLVTACKLILLVQLSSAAVERVFSLLANSFSEQQTSAMDDYIETSIMLQYNYGHEGIAL